MIKLQCEDDVLKI